MLEMVIKGMINVKFMFFNRYVGILSDGDIDNIEGKDVFNDISWRDIGVVLDYFFLVFKILIMVFIIGFLIVFIIGISDF